MIISTGKMNKNETKEKLGIECKGKKSHWINIVFVVL